MYWCNGSKRIPCFPWVKRSMRSHRIHCFSGILEMSRSLLHSGILPQAALLPGRSVPPNSWLEDLFSLHLTTSGELTFPQTVSLTCMTTEGESVSNLWRKALRISRVSWWPSWVSSMLAWVLDRHDTFGTSWFHVSKLRLRSIFYWEKKTTTHMKNLPILKNIQEKVIRIKPWN